MEPRVGYQVPGVRSFDNAVTFYYVRIPFTRIFHGALLCFIIHTNDSEAFGESMSPLEVIEQRPDKISTNIHTILHSETSLDDVILEIIEAASIVDFSIGRDGVREGCAVLCDVDGRQTILVVDFVEQSSQGGRADFPAHFSVLRAGDGINVPLR